MLRLLGRAVILGTLGAFAAAISMVIAYSSSPAVMFEMDRDLPQIVSGVYAPERDRDLTFAWSSERSELSLRGLDRRIPWTCSLRFRGGRSDPLPQPVVDLLVDGVRLASHRATNEFQNVEVSTPQHTRTGLVFTVASSSTFVPGPGDQRNLGVQIDRIGCEAAGGVPLPPRETIGDAMLVGALWGAALALLTATASAATGATLLLGAALAIPLTAGAAPYGTFGGVAVGLAAWIAALMVIVVVVLEGWTRQPLRNTARFAIGFTAFALFLRLLALMHPSKPLVDAVFQAHRLEWVLSGRFFFTQPMPDGVQFPYAIGLYAFAAPWSLLTDDHVSLLRIIVCGAEAIAGALLYPMIVRASGDRLAGALATGLVSLVPISYAVLGNANLTNAFGQSVALVTIAAVTLLSLQPRQFGQFAALAALTALALLSHVSTLVLLLATLAAVAFFFWWLGGPALRVPARWVCLAAAVALAFSVAVYYGRFIEVYKGALRVRASSPTSASAQAVRALDSDPTRRGEPSTENVPFPTRVANTFGVTVDGVGWPILLLGAVGAWRFVTARRRDRVALAVASLAAAYVAFVAVSLVRVDVQYQRYAYEFVGRVVLATYPAAVILAGHGAAWAWRAGVTWRTVSLILLAGALTLGVRSWWLWMQ